MSLADDYVQNYGQIPDFFKKLQDGQAPDQFTQQHLKDLGFMSSNYRAFIPLMKSLGFLTPEGIPTPRYHEYRSKAQARKIMAEALREAYSDVFVIKERPTDSDRQLIEGKFKSAHNASDRVAKLMASTFYSLLDLADLDHIGHKKEKPEEIQEEKNSKDQEKQPSSPAFSSQQSSGPSLHYNIQIHLPATKDIEVFNAIFKSLKEHLFE